MSAIVDGNVTTLIAAAVLWFKGSGTVKGFAQTLAIGIVVSMFTALVITRMIVFAFYGIGIRKESLYYHKMKERKANQLPWQEEGVLQYFYCNDPCRIRGYGSTFCPG